MSWYWFAGILARRGKAYQRSSGDSAAQNTAQASRTRLALRRIPASLPDGRGYGCAGTVVSSGLGDVRPDGEPSAPIARTRASARARPVAAAIRARMRGLPGAVGGLTGPHPVLMGRQVRHRSNGRVR